MNAAAVVVEILVAGLGALVWLGLLIFAFVDIGEAKALAVGWEDLATWMVLGFAYVLGTLIDRVADYVLSYGRVPGLVQKLGQSFANRDTSNEHARMQLLVIENKAADFLAYLRSTVRVTRTVTVNAFLITASGALYALSRHTPWLSLLVLVVGFALSALSFTIYAGSERSFHNFLGLACSSAVGARPSDRGRIAVTAGESS